MIFYVENETNIKLPIDYQNVIHLIGEKVLEDLSCPYEVEVNISLIDSASIQKINHEFRNIDKVTDVLSFPNLEFECQGDFEHIDEQSHLCFQPDTGELILGDIVVNLEKVIEQAKLYGHSQLREFAFLIAHSMFHLCGYDHMTEDETKEMEEKQNQVLEELNITRDSE